MKFASGTDVPVERSRAELESTVRKYGAARFMTGWNDTEAVIGFEMMERQIRFVLPLPNPNDTEFTHYSRSGSSKLTARKPHEANKKWEQACRQRWRALNLVIKAKLEAVECGITMFEEEFLAHIVLPGNKTAGEYFIPQIKTAYEEGKLPPLLPFHGKKG